LGPKEKEVDIVIEYIYFWGFCVFVLVVQSRKVKVKTEEERNSSRVVNRRSNQGLWAQRERDEGRGTERVVFESTGKGRGKGQRPSFNGRRELVRVGVPIKQMRMQIKFEMEMKWGLME